MGLRMCSECGAMYQPLVGGGAMNLCGNCISAGMNDSLYNETGYEEYSPDSKADEDIIPDGLLDELIPGERDDSY